MSQRKSQEPAPDAAGNDTNPAQKTPARSTVRQVAQASSARRAAQRRDLQQARNAERNSSVQQSRVSPFISDGSTQTTRGRNSLTGGPLRRTPLRDPSTATSGSRFADLSEHYSNSADVSAEEAEGFQQQQHSDTGHSRPGTGYHHGYVTQVEWSKELDELEPPTLLLATPEAILDFRIKWTDYSMRLGDIAAKQQRFISPKTVYDCIERHNRIYICGVSNLLPKELQGHPNDVPHVVLHDLIMQNRRFLLLQEPRI